ncbi:unnamed protein product [Rotaria sordida]|uniref:HTH OST-type domain-containing protein n=1 Tax=Rotaria sordida TaxID=392033 RepID=A0A815E1V8_9BILA|nr:unnamed protein product [Rotaria sordida]
MIECFNATFVPQITKLQDRENNNWDEFLLPIIFAYNTVVHATTDYSQFQLQFGHEPCLSIDEPSTPFLFNKPQDYYEQMKKNLSIIQRQARDYIINREQQYKNNYDKQRQDPHYEINDLLLLRIFSRSMSDKFVPFHLRDTHNPPPYLDHSQQQSWIHAGKKAKINHQRQQKYPPFIVSSSISEIKHMACCSPSPTYNQVKEEIYHLFTSTLIPSIDAGLTLTELCREYESCYKHGPIPYNDLGYDTLSRFLGSMKDVICMNYKEWPTRCYLNTNGNVDQDKSKRKVRTGTETYDEVKKDIYSILVSSLPVENGLSFTELCQQYSLKNDGQKMPFEQLGYATLTDLLKTMWGVVRIQERRCYLRVEETMKVHQKKKKHNK